jgi:hypothetical protein
VALWLDYDNADHKCHRYFARYGDGSDEKDREGDKDERSALSEWNPDWLIGQSRHIDDEAQAPASHTGDDTGEGGGSSSAIPSAVIDRDDSFNGVGMSCSPLNGTKLGKHGPNVLDYDYLTRVKE